MNDAVEIDNEVQRGVAHVVSIDAGATVDVVLQSVAAKLRNSVVDIVPAAERIVVCAGTVHHRLGLIATPEGVVISAEIEPSGKDPGLYRMTDLLKIDDGVGAAAHRDAVG